MIHRRQLLKAVAGATLLPSAIAARAQSDIKKIVVGFSPGTATDALGRMLAERMKGLYAPNLVVENRAGVSGQLAVLAVKAAPPDGSTILVSPMSMLTVSPHTFSKIAYGPNDLLPVGACATTDFAFAVGPAVPEQVTTIPQFIEWCKANPAKARFATGATGSTLHFAGIKLGLESGLKFTHIGYTNGGTALTDLAGGTVPAYVGVVPTVLPFLNRIRVLATMGPKRSRFLPNVPTLVEAGYKSMVVDETFGLYLPAGTPQDHAQRLNGAMLKALDMPEAQATMTTLGMEATPLSPAEMSAKLKLDFEKWGLFVKEIGFKQDT